MRLLDIGGYPLPTTANSSERRRQFLALALALNIPQTCNPRELMPWNYRATLELSGARLDSG